jgi:hypothetical protein
MKLYAMNLLYRVFKVKSRGSEIRAQVNTWFKLSTIAGHFHVNVSYKPTVNCSYYVFLAHSVTLKCRQPLEMIRLYLYKKCKLERDMTLCGDNWLYEEASLKQSGSSLLNSARKQ